ncbi:MAG: hypothetical protein WCE68_14610 [Anaerolineales bacterium]
MSDPSEDKPSPIQYFIERIHDLTMDSVLRDLPSYYEVITPKTTGREVADILEGNDHLPGMLVMQDAKLTGVISRDVFYERAGKKFGTEIYLGRPISVMMKTVDHKMLILPDSMLITLATQKALSRDLKSIYQPIVVEQPDKNYRLISALILFLAQSQQLLELHNQRLFTVDSGRNLSDEDAIKEFNQYIANQSGFDPAKLVKRQVVRCDNCFRMVNYSIVDIVRSFPQLNRGIIVEEKMGTRTYRLHVRHVCKNREVWEIPLLLDERLEYRSQRQARAVESYV